MGQDNDPIKREDDDSSHALGAGKPLYELG
jgi:hypothetical protein